MHLWVYEHSILWSEQGLLIVLSLSSLVSESLLVAFQWGPIEREKEGRGLALSVKNCFE